MEHIQREWEWEIESVNKWSFVREKCISGIIIKMAHNQMIVDEKSVKVNEFELIFMDC